MYGGRVFADTVLLTFTAPAFSRLLKTFLFSDYSTLEVLAAMLYYKFTFYITHNAHTHNRFTALLEYVRDHPGEQV